MFFVFFVLGNILVSTLRFSYIYILFFVLFLFFSKLCQILYKKKISNINVFQHSIHSNAGHIDP